VSFPQKQAGFFIMEEEILKQFVDFASVATEEQIFVMYKEIKSIVKETLYSRLSAADQKVKQIQDFAKENGF
jgi:hypothetical protein